MPIRLRITLATTGLMIIALAALGTGVYITMASSLRDNIDNRLHQIYDNYRQEPGIWLTSEGQVRGLIPQTGSFTTTGAIIQITNDRGEVRSRSQNLGDDTIPVDMVTIERNRNFETVYYNSVVDDVPVRVLSARLTTPDGTLIAFVQIAESRRQMVATLNTLKRNIIWGGLFSTLMLASGAYLVGDAAMRPLARMSNTARSIGRTGDLSHRLQPPKTGDEAQQLGETFNEMLARLEETFNAQRRFVADASHELRTPLTALRANADIMLRQIEGGIYDRDDLAEGLADVRDEVDRMTRLVQHLLTLARADVGWRPELDVIDLVDTARDAARVASPLVRGQRFDVNTPLPGPDGLAAQIDVRGNADQLRQLILILLDNAFTYAPADSDVTLSVNVDGSHAVLSVHDTGPGIAPDHLRRIFERFFRTDDARARSSGGTGLGLAIARWIVAVHDGQITAASTPGEGTTFEVRLPLLPASTQEPRTRGEATKAAATG